MKRRILAVSPVGRDAVESLLGEMLGEGWGRGCLTGYPQPSTPAAAKPTPTVYVVDAHLSDAEAAKVEMLADTDAALTLARATAVAEPPTAEPRKTLREVLTEHAAKQTAAAEGDLKDGPR